MITALEAMKRREGGKGRGERGGERMRVKERARANEREGAFVRERER